MPTIVDVPERQTAFLRYIASAFACIPGVEAVAWCGSAAIQKADSLSDYDLYVYWRTPVPLDARKKIIAGRASEYLLDNTFWELEDEWIEPDGLRFNVMYRSCHEAEEEKFFCERSDSTAALPEGPTENELCKTKPSVEAIR